MINIDIPLHEFSLQILYAKEEGISVEWLFFAEETLYLHSQLFELHSLIAQKLGEGSELFGVDDVGLLLEIDFLGLPLDEEESSVGGEGWWLFFGDGVAAIGCGDISGGFGEGLL